MTEAAQPVVILTYILIYAMSHGFSFLLPHNFYFKVVSKGIEPFKLINTVSHFDAMLQQIHQTNA